MAFSAQKTIKVIVTGSTGMVGEGVAYECLQHPLVTEVLLINRKPGGMNHPKIKEIIHTDFFNFSAIEDQLKGYDACFFCLGISSVGVKEEDYFRMTYTLTLHVAETLSRLNTDMTFCYISGAGTDSTEKGRSSWARIKGKTENDLFKLPFRHVYGFRPGYINPTKGLKNTLPYYKYFSWAYPFWKAILPKYVLTLKEIGLAMINSVNHGPEQHVLEVKDIEALASVQG